MIKFYQNNHSLLTISTFSYKKTLINYIFFINNNNKNILEIYFYNTENRKIIKINNSSKILILH